MAGEIALLDGFLAWPFSRLSNKANAITASMTPSLSN